MATMTTGTTRLTVVPTTVLTTRRPTRVLATRNHRFDRSDRSASLRLRSIQNVPLPMTRGMQRLQIFWSVVTTLDGCFGVGM